MTRPQGPNVKKLIVRFMSVEAVPKNGGFADGIKYLTDPKGLTESARRCTEKTFAAIDAVKAARDNPYGTDDEVIAGVILDQIEQRKATK